MTTADSTPGTAHLLRVLVMDDEPTLRTLTAQVLERSGYTVYAAADGHEAIEIFQSLAESGTALDLAILDLHLPSGPDGGEVLEAMRAVQPDLPAIACSGSLSPIGQESAASAKGFSAFLPKPYSLADLREFVVRYGRPPPSPPSAATSP